MPRVSPDAPAASPPKVDRKLTWWAGRPLSEGKNAHKTNTREQFQAALRTDCNWFEGDVRKELHGSAIEMRHDTTQETGDNLTLVEWLRMGKACGRGLKLDVKEPAHMGEIVAAVKAAGVPSERVMWNLGDAAMDAWCVRLRKDFPQSILAINPTGDGTLTEKQADRMIDLAEKGGAPVAFVVRYDRLTDEDIAHLKRWGPVSVWNDVGKGGLTDANLPGVTKKLRARGVDGIIDLHHSYGVGEKLNYEIDQGANRVGELFRNLFGG